MTSFSEDLRRFGPDSPIVPMSLDESLAYCRRLAETHYENFTVASFLLSKRLRSSFHVVYAYCRWADDLGDEIGGSDEERKESLRLLDWWEGELDRCFEDDKPQSHPVYVALRKIVREFGLLKQPFVDLLFAFRQDQTRRRYETLEELLDYCRFSADPVGRIVLQLAYSASGGGGPSEQELRWSDSICTGLQLANHWQDIARDARIGRCYIPQEVASRFGVDCEHLSETDEFRRMMRFLVDDARSRLCLGEPLIASVPQLVRPEIALFQRGGLAILAAIEKAGSNVLRQRPVVSRWTKLRLLLGAGNLKVVRLLESLVKGTAQEPGGKPADGRRSK